ncbi:phage exclusion protein Lit family protein [uncultured Xanthomonas sp.]|uniref:phage exclusion protein Lit family protein n=1 Tax=uncultured Xanthomonas sp. TaxID=152831 RepID=UPI0025EB8DAC|nr:phage exclusion protein Lit family protein [uncultured Xanthomonas sp.]
MHSPILILEGNIIQAFENPNGSAVEQLRRAIEEQRVSNEISMDLTPGPPRAPRAVRSNEGPSKLELHVAHLELLWAFIYGWFVIYERGVQLPMLDSTFDGRIHFDTPLKERAARLLDWAASLKDEYTNWPEDLPSPADQHDREEYDISLKTNGVFQQAVAFFLFHEFAHAQQGHLDFIATQPDVPVDQQSVLEMEKEADEFAYRVMVSADDDEDTLVVKAWPILAAVLSSFYLIHGPQEVYQERHPHLHQRVAHMLAKLNFPAGKHHDYYHFLSATVLKLSMEGPFVRVLSGLESDEQPETFDSAVDALSSELDTLDDLVEEIRAALNRGG